MAIITAYDNPLLNSALTKAWRRLMPFMFLMYFVAFIDRVNVGFAKNAIQADLALSNSAYALGAGIFFASYALCGIPSNLIMNKVGARKWLGITTTLWGLLSACTGFITSETQFIIIRFLLGVGEAGFYPGILLLASIFFPNKVRGSVVGLFVLAVPFALTLGSPISGALLEMHGFMGKPGWFWMFVLEGLPAVVLGIICFFYLDDSPATARFLTEDERQALVAQLQEETGRTAPSTVTEALRNGRVWHLALIYGTIQIGVYGLMFFLPSQVAGLMGSQVNFTASLVTAIPWAVAAVGVYYIPRYADKHMEKRVPISVITMVAAAAGLSVSAYAGPVVGIMALCVCAVGFLAIQPIFWTFPPQLLSGAALAAGIGFITTLGALGSFLAPIIRVQAEELLGSTTAGLNTLAVFTLICALLIMLLGKSFTKTR